jgi:hypothetical protein
MCTQNRHGVDIQLPSACLQHASRSLEISAKRVKRYISDNPYPDV